MNTEVSQTIRINFNQPWEKLVEEFIKNADRKPTSKETYKRALKAWITFLDTTQESVEENQPILQYKSYLIDKNLSPYTISMYLATLRVFLDYLVQTKVIPFNPAKIVKGAKRLKSRRDSLTDEEIIALVSAIQPPNTLEDSRNNAILWLKLATGLRDISIVHADIGDIQVKSGKPILYYLSKGKDTKDEFVVLRKRPHQAIMDYIEQRKTLNLNAPLFISHSDRNNNERLTTKTIRRVIRQFLTKAGIKRPQIYPHCLRHTAITLAILEGADITQAQDMAGHKNINVTMEYHHNVQRMQDPAEMYVERHIDKLMEGKTE